MSNKISALAIVGLSAVCVTSLWMNRQHNSDPLAGSASVLESASPESEVGTVSVFGSEEVNFAADQFVTTLTLWQNDKNKEKAFELLGEHRKKVVELLEKLGYDKTDYEWNGSKIFEDWNHSGKKSVLLGYIATQTIDVRSSSRDKSDSLELELTAYPFVVSAHTSGRLKNADSLEVAVIKKACHKATQMANEYAGSVDAKIGKVYSVEGNSRTGHYGYTDSDSVKVSAEVSADIRLAGYSDDGRSYVEVTQSENKKFAADKFQVPLNIVFRGANKEQLYKSVELKRDSILAMAKELGVAPSEMDVKGIHVGRSGSRSIRHEENKNEAFFANQQIKVNFTSKRAAAVFYAALSGEKNVEIWSVNSLLSNEDSLRVQVVNVAGKKAMARAKAIAEGFDLKLGRVFSVGNNENKVGAPMLMKSRIATNGFEDGLTGLLGGGDGYIDMNIADSVDISAFLKVVVEMK